MQGAIGNMLRNTLGITKVQHSHAPPAQKKKKSGSLGACCLPHWLQEFFCLCVFFTIFGPVCQLPIFWEHGALLYIES
jgi:hypothetical protein